MKSAEIKHFPMPPVSNSKSVISEYETDVKYWLHKNAYQLQNIRLIVSQMSHDEAFRLDKTFNFLYHKILNSNRKPLKNDAASRLKCLENVLCRTLGIDEALLWDGACFKQPSHHVALGEFVDLKFTVIRLDYPIADLDA